MKIFGSITELVSAVFRKNSQQITVQPNSGTTYTADRIVNLPPGDAAHTLVSADSTQTLTNKSVDGDTNTLSNVAASSIKTVLGDANKVILRNGSGAVVSAQIVNANIDAAAAIALSKLATVTASRALQSDGTGIISASSVTTTELGHVSGVTSSIQTQLNAKEPTITVLPVSKGGTNSSTSLNNSRVMISSGSAIVEGSAITASRALASDAGGLPVASTTTSTELGYVSGVTSAVQTQINAKADTSALTAHTGASTGVHGVTGSVVGTTDTQVLTNKDIDGGTASNTSRTTLPKANKSVLDGLTRKQATLLYGSDTNKVYADDGSTLKEIGSGSSGINYLSSQFNADALGTVELSVGDTLASTTRANPNQWGNSAASALITQSTDSTLRGTTNYLVAFSANAQFVESPLFSIDGQDLSKPLLVQFDVSGVVTADDVQVYIARYNSSNVLQERILVAGTASATSPNSAQVPTAVTTFRGFFIPSSTATDKYAIRWRRNANNTSMRLDTFIVGPQSLAQGAVVTAWQDFVPTISNFGTPVTNVIAKYSRVGNTIFVKGSCTAGTTAASAFSISLPSGLSFDTTLGAGKQMVGRLEVLKSAAGPNTNAFSDYQALFLDTATNASVVYAAYQNGSGVYVKNTGSGITSSGNSINYEFNAPISQWSSGTTTLADRAVEEYASNSGAEGTAANTQYSNSSYFVNGPNGSLVPSVNSTTANGATEYLCRFQTAILPTDSILLEVQQIGTGAWLPVYAGVSGVGMVPYQRQATSYYGIGFSRVSGSSTDIYVIFGNYGARPGGAGAAFSSVGDTWSNFTAYRWRLRKVQSGAAVGFPVSARNIVGSTDGSVVPSGYIGEYKQQNWTGVTPLNNTAYFNPASVVLGAGVWVISLSTGGGSAGSANISGGISTDSGTTFSDIAAGSNFLYGYAGTAGLNDSCFALPNLVVNLSSQTTYYAKVKVGGTISGTNYGRLTAIRIA